MDLVDSILNNFKDYRNRVRLLKRQSPLATVLTCSDSRVQLGMLSSSPENDFFVVRNIGGQLATAKGSVDYGIVELGTKYLIIISHSGCGAVKTSLEDYMSKSRSMRRELDSLHLSYSGNDLSDADKYSFDNLMFQVKDALQEYSVLVSKGSLIVLGLHYDVSSSEIVYVSKNGDQVI